MMSEVKKTFAQELKLKFKQFSNDLVRHIAADIVNCLTVAGRNFSLKSNNQTFSHS